MVSSGDTAHMEVTTVHAEGSMEAQRMMILIESPLKEYRDLALRAAGVAAQGVKPALEDWQSGAACGSIREAGVIVYGRGGHGNVIVRPEA